MLLRAINANLPLVGSLPTIHLFAIFIISYFSVSFAFRITVKGGKVKLSTCILLSFILLD